MKCLVLPVHSSGGNWDVMVALVPWEGTERAVELLDEMILLRKIRWEHHKDPDFIFGDNSIIYMEPTEELEELAFGEEQPKTAEMSERDISEGLVGVETTLRRVSEGVVWWSAYVKHSDVLLETCMVGEDFLKKCATCIST